MKFKEWLLSPWGAVAIGLLVFPLAKLLWIPNYVFNFLTTLIHEIGHSLAAWLMGMPSIPTVSIFGGGVAVWGEQVFILCLALMAALGFTAWNWRKEKRIWIPVVAVLAVYPFLAFTGARVLVAGAGGIGLEILGGAICFFAVFAVELERPFERPLYALWGWWMILNRGAETVLMLSDRGYWNQTRVIESGLAAGMTSDLSRLQTALGTSPGFLLSLVLMGCLLAFPAAWAAAWWIARMKPLLRTEEASGASNPEA